MELVATISPLERTKLIHSDSFYLAPKASRLPHATNAIHKQGSATNAGIEPRLEHSVLIVEDDPDISMALQDLLEFEGFQVDCVQTCRHAFSSLEHHDYDAVLLDLGLPDGDGRSILEKLQVSNPSLPVIVLTASGRDLGSLPTYAHLTKPWKRDELCSILRQAIGLA